MIKKILDIGVALAADIGYKQVTFKRVARRIGCTRTLMYYYFNDQTDLQNQVILRAVKVKNWKVIVQAAVIDDPVLKKVSQKLIDTAYIKVSTGA